MIAEYERSQITERTRRGRLHKARKAEFMSWAYRIYGYRSTPKQAGMPPRVAIHPEQADVVREIFGWLLHEQLTTRQIVKRLNAQHIPTRPGRNQVWHAASVRSISRRKAPPQNAVACAFFRSSLRASFRHAILPSLWPLLQADQIGK